MARGKYAERTRTRREAEDRYKSALAESNRLRSELHRIRSLETQNHELLRAVRDLREQVEQGSSARVQNLEAEVAFLRTDRNLLQEKVDRSWDRMAHAIIALASTNAAKKNSSDWWEQVTAVANHLVRSGPKTQLFDGLPLELQRILMRRALETA